MGHFGKASVIGLLACFLVGNAWADRYYHRHPRTTIHWGINLGVPVYPPYYPYPYPVYAPPVVVVPAAPPPVYVERPAAVVMEPGYWYYCNEAQAYYPHVQQCPGPWQKVAPQAPRQ
jgi:hypothetical protein